MTAATHEIDPVLVERWADRVRLALLAGGALALIASGAAAFGMHQDPSIGPAQLQVGIFGLLLLLAGIARAPSREIGRLLVRARERQTPPALIPLTRRSRLGLTSVVLFAFIFRLWMALTYAPTNQMAMGMTLGDAEMARNLLAGRGWVLNEDFVKRVDRAVVERGAMVDPQDYLPADDARPGALRPFDRYAHTPGYSLWLALSFAIGGAQRFLYSQVMQSALDASACLLVFGIGRRLWSNTAGVIGASIYALSPAHVYLAIQTVAAATDSFWVLIVAYGIVRTWDDSRRRRSAFAGTALVVIGAFGGTVMNSVAFVLPFASALWAGAVGIVARPAWRVVAPLLVAQILVMALLMPWALRNQRVHGQLAFTRQTFWQFAWETLGAVPNPWGLAMGNSDAVYWSWVAANCPTPCSPIEREATTRDYLFRHVFASEAFPGHLLRVIAHQLPGLVYVSRLPADEPYTREGLAGRVTQAGVAVANAAMLLMWPAALCGLALVTVRGRDGMGGWLGLAPTLFIVAFSLTFLVEHRRTTTAYGYLVALAAIPGAAMLERHAEHH